jgi:hypothetical protein
MEQPITRRCLKKKEIERVGLIFRCPERVDRIERVCKRVNYEDIMLALEFTTPVFGGILPIPTGHRIAKVNVKLGEGWIGRDAEIRSLKSADNGEPYGILVILNISDLTPDIRRCWIKNLKDTEDTVLIGEFEDILCEKEGDSDELLRTIRRQLKEMGKTLLKRPAKVAR